MYAVFDLGVIGYWAVPTAPPWYAARRPGLGDDDAALRRMMVEHGEAFWKDRWGPLYSVLGGNPLAAMPSLHFATSADGRAPARARRARSRARSAGRTRSRSASRSSTWASTTSIDLSPARR